MSSTTGTGGTGTLTTNVIEVSMMVLGAALLPIYGLIYAYDESLFNMVQCTHVILMCLYAALYLNFIKGACFDLDEGKYQLLNIVFMYTMFVFFFMFAYYIYRIFAGRH